MSASYTTKVNILNIERMHQNGSIKRINLIRNVWAIYWQMDTNCLSNMTKCNTSLTETCKLKYYWGHSCQGSKILNTAEQSISNNLELHWHDVFKRLYVGEQACSCPVGEGEQVCSCTNGEGEKVCSRTVGEGEQACSRTVGEGNRRVHVLMGKGNRCVYILLGRGNRCVHILLGKGNRRVHVLRGKETGVFTYCSGRGTGVFMMYFWGGGTGVFMYCWERQTGKPYNIYQSYIYTSFWTH